MNVSGMGGAEFADGGLAVIRHLAYYMVGEIPAMRFGFIIPDGERNGGGSIIRLSSGRRTAPCRTIVMPAR